MSILAIVLIILGVFLCPIFTLGCVLVHFDQNVLGTVVIVLSLLVPFFKSE